MLTGETICEESVIMQELNTRLLTLGASGMRGVVGTGLTPGAASGIRAFIPAA